MMLQILCNVNSCLIKFKRLGVSTSSGHPTFWHCLWQELREPFWKSKILLCLLSWALQPSSKSLQMTSMEPPLLLLWRHSAPHVISELILSSPPQFWKQILILWLPCLPRKCQQPSNPLRGWWSHLFIGCEMNISRGPCYDFCTEISMPCPSEMAFHHSLAQHTLGNTELTFPIKHIIFTQSLTWSFQKFSSSQKISLPGVEEA